MTNQDVINQFFEAYSMNNFEKIGEVMSEEVVWYFLGRHKLAGIKSGIKEVIDFFDAMGAIMKKSQPTVDKLIVSENDKCVIECQHIKTNRKDGINIDHYVTVLWTIENGKIISGRHFFAAPEAVDYYFNAVPLPEK